MIELKHDNSSGMGKKPYYFTDPTKATFKKGSSVYMTYNQSQFVKKAMEDVGIRVLDRTKLWG